MAAMDAASWNAAPLRRGFPGAPRAQGAPFAASRVPRCAQDGPAWSEVSEQMEQDIHEAQCKAFVKRLSLDVPEELSWLAAKDFYGNWTDSFGNTVCVYSTDAFKTELVASLSKPPRPDIRLQLRKMDNGQGWFCGKAVLSSIGEEIGELTWTFPNGKVSVWRRKDDDAGDREGGEAIGLQATPTASQSSPTGSQSWCGDAAFDAEPRGAMSMRSASSGDCLAEEAAVFNKYMSQTSANTWKAEKQWQASTCLTDAWGVGNRLLSEAYGAHDDGMTAYVMVPCLVTM